MLMCTAMRRVSTVVLSKYTHRALLTVLAWKALRQPCTSGSSRGAFFVCATSALGAEFLVRHNTERAMPVGHLRARARRARARSELQRQALRRRAALLAARTRRGAAAAPIGRRGLQAIGFVALLALLRRITCLLYTSPSPRDRTRSRMPSSA